MLELLGDNDDTMTLNNVRYCARGKDNASYCFEKHRFEGDTDKNKPSSGCGNDSSGCYSRRKCGKIYPGDEVFFQHTMDSCGNNDKSWVMDIY